MTSTVALDIQYLPVETQTRMEAHTHTHTRIFYSSSPAGTLNIGCKNAVYMGYTWGQRTCLIRFRMMHVSKMTLFPLWFSNCCLLFYCPSWLDGKWQIPTVHCRKMIFRLDLPQLSPQHRAAVHRQNSTIQLGFVLQHTAPNCCRASSQTVIMKGFISHHSPL